MVVVTLLIFFSVASQNNEFSQLKFRESLFVTVSIFTTTGFGSADYELWPVFVQAVLLTLMFVGGMGGSTGGVMKVIRCTLLVKYAALEPRRMLHSRALIHVKRGQKLIIEDVVRNT